MKSTMRHAGLPLVPLPDVAVGLREQVARSRALGEQRRALRDVRLIQTQMRRPVLLQPRAACLPGRGRSRGSQSKSHQWNSRIQKQSKWKTDSGRSRSAMPSMNW